MHGCCTSEADVGEWDTLGEEISNTLKKHQDWEIVVRDWSYSTPVPPILDIDSFKEYADFAWNRAFDEGQLLAAAIERPALLGKPPYEYIHLIGHSAGARLIDQASQELVIYYKIKGKEMPFIHLTFLDAYTPDEDNSVYGNIVNYPHYAEHYVDRHLKYTDTCLRYGFNFDISNWSHSADPFGDPFGHQWPRHWYEKSVVQTDQGFKNLKYGYALSLEGGTNNYKKLIEEYPKDQQCALSDEKTKCKPASCW